MLQQCNVVVWRQQYNAQSLIGKVQNVTEQYKSVDGPQTAGRVMRT